MTDQTIANTILEQLGNNKFIVMTGAKNFISFENGLAFTLPHKKIKQVQIILNSKDLYNMVFLGVNKRLFNSIKEIAIYVDVYNDQLQSIFTEVTGLDTHL